MRSPRSALLLVPVLLAGAMPARAQPSTCQAGEARLELSATPAAPAALCIRPGLSTTLIFDAPLTAGAVVLEGREHFRVVDAGSQSLLLVPSDQLPAGARLELEVRFADGQVPESARFTLVAHAAQAARLVEVARAKSVTNVRAAELREVTEQLRRCEAQVASLSDDALDVIRVFESGMLDESGLTAQALGDRDFAQGPGEDLKVRNLTFYRTRGALVLKVRVKNPDSARPWLLAGATLLGRNGEALQAAAMHPAEPVPPGETHTRWVAWELPPPKDKDKDKDKDTASYTLHLWDAGKARSATVPGLKLP